MAPIAWGPGSVTCEDSSIDVPSIAIPALPAVQRRCATSSPAKEPKNGWKNSRNGAQTALGRLETASPSQKVRAAKLSQAASRDGARTACGRLEEMQDARAGHIPCLSPAPTSGRSCREGTSPRPMRSPDSFGEKTRCSTALSGIREIGQLSAHSKMKSSRLVRPRITLEAAPVLDSEKHKAGEDADQNDSMAPEVADYISQLQNRITSFTSTPYRDDGRRFSEKIRSRARSQQQSTVRVLIQENPVTDRLEIGLESTMGDTTLNSSGGSPSPRRSSKTTPEILEKLSANSRRSSLEDGATPKSKTKNPESPKTAKSLLRRHARERDKSMDKNMLDSEAPIVHAIIPADHRGFELGGRNGNLVIQVHGGQESFVQLETGGLQEDRVMIEKGWKVIGFDFKLCPVRWIKANIMKARLQNRECCVTFEVTKDVAQRLGKSVCKQAMARFFLEEHFSCKSLEEIEQLDPHIKNGFLRDPKLLWLMVNAKATMELEVLLGTKNASMLQLSLELRRALRLGSNEELQSLMRHDMAADALLQRDAGGNVVLHYCKNMFSVRLLYEYSPQAKDVRNSANQLPLQSYLTRNPEDAEVLHVLSSSELDLFQRDDNGVSPAMVTQGTARDLVEKLVAPWEEMKDALQLHYSEVLSALEKLEPHGLWPSLLSFHCFGETRVWKDGRHTINSRARLEIVWGSISAALQSLLNTYWPLHRDAMGAHVAQVLLNAAKGPRHERLDPREVYRRELTDMLLGIEEGCRRILHGHYRDLVKSDCAEWLLSTPNEIDAESCSEEIGKLGMNPRLEIRLPPPTWLAVPDLQVIFDDLQRQKIIGATHEGDAVHDLLRLANVCSELDELDAENDVVLVRWYAAWLQSVCCREKQTLSAKVEAGLGKSKNYRAEQEALETISVEDVCHKTATLLRHLKAEWSKSMPSCQSEVSEGLSSKTLARYKQKLIRKGARLVHDINVLIFTAVDSDELYKLYDKILQSGLKIVCTDNAFSRSSKVLSSFRDLRMCVECHTDSGPLLVDLQLNLETCIAEKRLSRLSEMFLQGGLDWHHVFLKSKDVNVRHAKEVVREALKKKHAPAVLTALNQAAKVGVDDHYIAMVEGELAKLTDDLLQKAIDEESTSLLQLAINVAICIPTQANITEAVRLLGRLEKDANERHAAAEMIAAALLKKNTSDLRQALLKAQSCNLESEQVNMAERIFEKHVDLIEQKMSDALYLKDFVGIANALRDAWIAGLDHEGIELAQDILQELQVLDRYAKAVESKDAAEIRNAVLEMQVLELKGEDVEKAEALWRTLRNVPLRLRACKNTKGAYRSENPWEQYELQNSSFSQLEAEVIRLLENALRVKTPATLNSAISRARKIGVSCPQLTAAERLLKRFISEAETILLFAMTQTSRSGDHHGLYEAINTARNVGCNPHNITKAEAVLSKCLAAIALQEAMASGDNGTLQEAIIDAQAKEVDPAEVIVAEELLAKFRRASLSLREAIDNEHVEDLLDLLGIAARAQVSEVIVRSAGECVVRLKARALEKLRLATRERKLHDLHYALIDGRKAALDATTLIDAENAYEYLKQDFCKLLQNIADDELDVSIPELEEEIAVARLVGLEIILIKKAEAALSRRMNLQKRLQEAVNTLDLGTIRTAIRNAKQAGALSADLKTAYDYMADVKASSTAKLRKAMTMKDPTLIHEAIHDGMNAGVDDNVLRDAQWLVSKLSQGLSLLQKAIKSKKNCSTDLHNAISNAYALGLKSSEVAIAEELLESWKSKSLKLLDAAIKTKDPKALRQAIAEGKKSMLTEKHELDVLAKAEYLLYGYVTKLEEELKESMKAKDTQKLEETIMEAWSAGIELKLIKDARDLLAVLYAEEISTREHVHESAMRKQLPHCKSVYGIEPVPPRDPLPTEEEEEEALAEYISAPVDHTTEHLLPDFLEHAH